MELVIQSWKTGFKCSFINNYLEIQQKESGAYGKHQTTYFKAKNFPQPHKFWSLDVYWADWAERHDLRLFVSPFLFPPKKRVKKKRKMNSKNCDFRSCLSAQTIEQSYQTKSDAKI